jgi:hypothetical protein
LYLCDQDPRVPQHLPQWLDDVGDRHVAARDFVKHRREENEILLRQQYDFDVQRAGELLLEVQSGVGTRETTAKNHDALLRSERAHLIHARRFALLTWTDRASPKNSQIAASFTIPSPAERAAMLFLHGRVLPSSGG